MRVKRSVHARKKRRATLELTKGFRGEAHSNYRRAKEALIKADTYAYRDRRNRKRDFRRLWITRINAAARQRDELLPVHARPLVAGVELDRKVLADIAVRDADTFRRFAEVAREASAAELKGRRHSEPPGRRSSRTAPFLFQRADMPTTSQNEGFGQYTPSPTTSFLPLFPAPMTQPSTSAPTTPTCRSCGA